MHRYIILLLLLGLFISFGASVALPQTANSSPSDIVCPSGQTVWLEGNGPPYESLLIFLNRRAVGGGTASASGTWRLPLRVQERPGIYPVEVRSRNTRSLLGSFSCFVDVPIGATATGTPTALPTSAAPRPTATQPRTTPTVAATATPTGTPGATRTGTPGTVTPTGTPGTATPGTATPGTATPGTATPGTATPGTATPGATPTQVASGRVRISATGSDDPNDPDNPGFVDIVNDTDQPIVLTGWRLVNLSRPNTIFIFPEYTLRARDFVTVLTNAGTDSSEELHWGLTGVFWETGQIAVLRDTQGREISRCAVDSICN